MEYLVKNTYRVEIPRWVTAKSDMDALDKVAAEASLYELKHKWIMSTVLEEREEE